jgi:hypothetical protein
MKQIRSSLRLSNYPSLAAVHNLFMFVFNRLCHFHACSATDLLLLLSLRRIRSRYFGLLIRFVHSLIVKSGRYGKQEIWYVASEV